MKKLKIILCYLVATFSMQKNYSQPASHQSKITVAHANNHKSKSFAANLSIQSVLRVHPSNHRYFTDVSGRAIYLTGSHTWSNVCDMTGPGGFQNASENTFLDWIAGYGHNFTRLWAFENDGFVFKDVSPLPYIRSGPGLASDGKPKYDLHQFNQDYFNRLRSKVSAAKDRGIYVSVVLFGHSGNLEGPTFFKKENNINGIDGDPNGDKYAIETRTLQLRDVTNLQDAYVKKVVETVNSFDNVLYEIACESDLTTTEWQYHMIRLIRKYETSMSKKHLIGMSSDGGYGPGDDTKRLFESPADWIAPGWDSDTTSSYMKNPPAATGKKIIMIDTDHLWGVGGDSKWVWKCFTRGLHPSYMDPYIELDPRATFKIRESQFDSARLAMGQTLKMANQLSLAAMTPHNELASTSFCLANPGKEYVIYLPEGGEVAVDLSKIQGSAKVQWMKPVEGNLIPGKTIKGGTKTSFEAPFSGDAVLYIVNNRMPLMTSSSKIK